MDFICDRIENGLAVLVDDRGRHFDLPIAAAEGVFEGAVVRITVDAQASEKRKKDLSELADRLFTD